MRLVFLGTASCFPTPARGVSCTALQWRQTGDVWIFDCGEGSQIQIQRSNLKPGKVSKIFITHLHGDHVFGLPGFLCTLGNGADISKIVDIYGPLGLKKLLVTMLELSQSPLPYKCRIHEIVPNKDQFMIEEAADLSRYRCPKLDFPWCANSDEETEDRLIEYDPDLKGWKLLSEANEPTVIAGPIKHRVPSFAYVIQERSSAGALDVKKCKSFGVSPGHKYSKLKSGLDVLADDGVTLVKSSDVVGPSRKGRKLAILGDTCDTSQIEDMCIDCDLLVHEATMENCLKDKAIEYGHSTPDMAAEFALKIRAKKLCLTHLSPRYKPVSLEHAENPDSEKSKDDKCASIILNEAKSYVENRLLENDAQQKCEVFVAEDFFEISL